jgi:hypothetical protein
MQIFGSRLPLLLGDSAYARRGAGGGSPARSWSSSIQASSPRRCSLQSEIPRSRRYWSSRSSSRSGRLATLPEWSVAQTWWPSDSAISALSSLRCWRRQERSCAAGASSAMMVMLPARGGIPAAYVKPARGTRGTSEEYHFFRWPCGQRFPAEEAVLRRLACSSVPRQPTIEANGIDCGASFCSLVTSPATGTISAPHGLSCRSLGRWSMASTRQSS